ncbi:hypothetical protein [Rhizobium leguminosarum]|uniref:hypothetical protein n=1 Tax=Rhizobium TaxID=379 RepID=UPI00140F6089|nr:hypothetical protein [Rhizobium leguminosarum]QIO64720.1 hypothetical protein HA462_06540 [Rhizobium leguminosarum bv. trifolii]
MSNHAAEILSLAEFIKVLGDAAKSVQKNAQQLAETAGELREQVHHAQRRLRMLEHTAGIIPPVITQTTSADSEERVFQ